MEKSGKPSGSKSRTGKSRDRAGRTPEPHPNTLFSSSADGAPVAPDPDIPDTGALPTAMGVEAKLVVEKGLHAGKVVKLGAGTVTIGRSSKCELSLKGSSGVSRRHCKIQFIGSQYALIDLESRNGTLVNGKTQPRSILKDGDLIEVCDEQIRFAAIGGAKQPPVVEDDIADRETQLLPADSRAAAAVLKKAAAFDDDLVAPTRAERSKSAAASRSKPPPLPAERASADFTAPFLQPDLDDEPAPPKAARAVARPPPLPPERGAARPRIDDLERDTVLANPEPKSGGFRAAHAVLIVMLLLLAALGVAAWDLTVGPKRLKALIAGLQIQEVAPASPAPAVAKEDAPSPKAPVEPTAGAPQPETPDGAVPATGAPGTPGTEQVAIDAQPKEPQVAPAEAAAAERPAVEVAKVEVAQGEEKPPTTASASPAATPEAPSAAATAEGTLEVAAKVGGVVARVSAKRGQKIAVGQTLAQLDGGGVNKKKLDVLYGEKKDFEAAVTRGIASAKRDLEAVEREIAALERGRKAVPLASTVAGTVVEVRIKAGDVVKAGDVIVTVTP